MFFVNLKIQGLFIVSDTLVNVRNIWIFRGTHKTWVFFVNLKIWNASMINNRLVDVDKCEER